MRLRAFHENRLGDIYANTFDYSHRYVIEPDLLGYVLILWDFREGLGKSTEIRTGETVEELQATARSHALTLGKGGAQ